MRVFFTTVEGQPQLDASMWLTRIIWGGGGVTRCLSISILSLRYQQRNNWEVMEEISQFTKEERLDFHYLGFQQTLMVVVDSCNVMNEASDGG